MTSDTTNLAEQRRAPIRARACTITLALLALVILALAFSGAVRGQGPAAASSAANDANHGATAPWEWPTPDARPLEIDRGAAGLWQTLLKLHTRASLLMVVAHPDDEDGGMLTYESRGQGARAILLTLNRGEGGQNVMSDDFWDALGLVRTEELLAADRYYGVQQFWGTVADFGFSKTREEALDLWGHDRLLEDAVRVVRMTRPLVITSVFVGGPTDGHGHHAAAGQIAQEVFASGRRPEDVSGADSRGIAAVVASENVRAGAHLPDYRQGHVRFGHGKIASRAFLRFHPQDMVGRTAERESRNSRGKRRSGAGRDLHANRAARLVAAEISEWRRRNSARRARARRLTTASIPRFRRPIRSNRILTASIFRWRASPISPTAGQAIMHF